MFVHSFGWGALRRSNAGLVPIWEQIATELAAAWRSDLGITLDESGNVSAWESQAGSLVVSLQHADDTVRPVYSEEDSNWGGLPSLTFDGANDRLQSSITTSSWKFLHDGTGATFLIVLRPTATTNNVRVCGTAVAVSQTGFQLVHSANGELDRFDVNFGDSSGSFPLTLQSTNGTAPENENHAVLWYLNSEFNPDGKLYYPPNTSRAEGSGTLDTVNNPTNNFVIGNWTNSAGGVPFKGSIVELAIWKRALDLDERATIANYVASRYGIGS